MNEHCARSNVPNSKVPPGEVPPELTADDCSIAPRIGRQKTPCAPVHKIIKNRYPDGFDGQTFNLRLPTSKEVYRMIKIEADEVQYMVKLGPAIEGVDYVID